MTDESPSNEGAKLNTPHPDDAEFADVRADLARLYIKHAADMALDLSDDEIVARTNEITALLITLAKRARANNDVEWLLRHRWFLNATTRLFDGGDAVPLDG